MFQVKRYPGFQRSVAPLISRPFPVFRLGYRITYNMKSYVCHPLKIIAFFHEKYTVRETSSPSLTGWFKSRYACVSNLFSFSISRLYIVSTWVAPSHRVQMKKTTDHEIWLKMVAARAGEGTRPAPRRYPRPDFIAQFFFRLNDFYWQITDFHRQKIISVIILWWISHLVEHGKKRYSIQAGYRVSKHTFSESNKKEKQRAWMLKESVLLISSINRSATSLSKTGLLGRHFPGATAVRSCGDIQLNMLECLWFLIHYIVEYR